MTRLFIFRTCDTNTNVTQNNDQAERSADEESKNKIETEVEFFSQPNKHMVALKRDIGREVQKESTACYKAGKN